MFRPSGPDHMLIRTVMFCLFSLSFLQESESQCKTKRQNTTNHKMKVYKIVNLLPNFLKKGPPLRGKFPLLLHPELHLAENPPLLPFPNARPPNSRGCRQAAPCSRRWCCVGEDKRAGAPPLESKSRCKGELRLPGLVVGHLLWVLLPESSYWPHSDVCPLSEFIFRIHPCHRIKV